MSKKLRKPAPRKNTPNKTGAKPSPPRRAAPGVRPEPTLSEHGLDRVAVAREVFWQNLLREILMSLAMISSNAPKKPAAEAKTVLGDDGEAALHAIGQDPANLFDGRLALITSLGTRIPIGDIKPVFGCGVKTPGGHWLSNAVECSVFEISTPAGEIFTMPVHEIRSFHSLTPELMKQIEAATSESEDPDQPFGFAAFRSLARSSEPAPVVSPISAPDLGE
jgi:hypothetical protein